MCHGMDVSMGSPPTPFGVLWVSLICRLMSFIKFRGFSEILFKYFLYVLLSPLSGTPITWILGTLVWPHNFLILYCCFFFIFFFQSVQLHSHVWLFATPWTAAPKASLYITNSQNLLRLIHPVSDAIQPSQPLLSPLPPAFDLSQHQSLFKGVSSSHQAAKVLEFQLQCQSFQWIFRMDFL